MKIDRVPMYLQSVTFTSERSTKDEGGRVRVVVATFMIQPFKRELARAIAPGAESKLFDMRSGEPTPEFSDVGLTVQAELSRLQLRMASDAQASIDLPAVRVASRVAVTLDKKTPTLRAVIRFRFTYPSAKDLLFLAHAINSQLVVDLFKAQPGLDFEDGATAYVAELGVDGAEAEEPAADGQEPVTEFRPLTDKEREAQAARPTARRHASRGAAH